MSKLYGPQSKEVFSALRKVVDFYYYKGQLCARRMPITCAQPGTRAQMATWQAFRDKIGGIRVLKPWDQDGYRTIAKGSDKTWADVFGSAYLRGWAIRGRIPPVVYDVITEQSGHQMRIGVRATEAATVKLVYNYFREGEYHDSVWWERNTLTQEPPNCTKRVELRESWDRSYNIVCVRPNDMYWTPWLPVVAGSQVVFSGRVLADGGVLDLMRVGVYYVSN